MSHQAELERIRTEYSRRLRDAKVAQLYTIFNPGNLFTLQNQERVLLKTLKRHDYAQLDGLSILDIGSGAGYHLLNLIRYGAMPANLVGLDLMQTHLQQARSVLPDCLHLQANAGELPFPDQSFDLAFMFTVLTSILDPTLKQTIAHEARRVVSSGGLLIIYDFKSSARSRHIQGVTPDEIRRLFPGAQIEFQAVTLAMRYAWRLAPYSWLLCSLLERLPPLTSHYLAAIRP